MVYDVARLQLPLNSDQLVRVREASQTAAGQQLAHSLASSTAGRTLARQLVVVSRAEAIAQSLMETADGRQLALSLAETTTGVTLALGLIESADGRALSLSLIDTVWGRRLALSLAGSTCGRALAISLAASGAGQMVALTLAGSRGGQTAAAQLAESADGRTLAMEWASRAADGTLAMEWAHLITAGRISPLEWGESNPDRAPVLQLAKSPAGDELARHLATNGAAQTRALTAIMGDRGLALAQALSVSNAGRQVARSLVESRAGLILATALAATGTGKRVAQQMEESAAAPFMPALYDLSRRRRLRPSSTTRAVLDRQAIAVAVLLLGSTIDGLCAAVVGGAAAASSAILFIAGVLTADQENDDPDSATREHVNSGEDPERIWSVDELYDLERISGRLDSATADRLRGRLEPFVGLVEQFLADGKYPYGEITAQVEYEVRQLREELFSENPVEPLATVVSSYFASLLDATQPLLNEAELRADANRQGVDGDILASLVQAGSHEPADSSDTTPAVEIANKAKALAPSAITSDRNRAEWAATVVGWATDTALKGAGGVAAGAGTAALNLSWLNPVWAAVVGGIIGIASAIAKIVRAEASNDATQGDSAQDG